MAETVHSLAEQRRASAREQNKSTTGKRPLSARLHEKETKDHGDSTSRRKRQSGRVAHESNVFTKQNGDKKEEMNAHR